MSSRKTLPHAVPLWVDVQKEIYFITLNALPRGGNHLAHHQVMTELAETVDHRQRMHQWWCHLFLVMPDHIHALITFPPVGTALQLRVSRWKAWTAKSLGIHWQRDFFEHRLRGEDERSHKATYILENPVRQGWATEPREWPFVWFANGPRPYGWPENA
jgi:REP element-mobilizing transposase RayT